MTSDGLANAPSGALPGRKVHDRQVFLLQLGAERQVGGRDDTGCVGAETVFTGCALMALNVAVGEAASGEDGERENGKDSVTH